MKQVAKDRNFSYLNKHMSYVILLVSHGGSIFVLYDLAIVVKQEGRCFT